MSREKDSKHNPVKNKNRNRKEDKIRKIILYCPTKDQDSFGNQSYKNNEHTAILVVIKNSTLQYHYTLIKVIKPTNMWQKQ